MRRGGKIAAYGSYHSPSSSSSGNVTSSTINTMLQELQQLIKKTQVRKRVSESLNDLNHRQEERIKSETTLSGVNKTHEKMKQEVRGMLLLYGPLPPEYLIVK